MNTRIEDIDGVRTYYVNDVAYKKLEDMPEEFRQYFTDANGDGFPDQFDSLVKMARGQAGVKDFLKSSVSEMLNTPPGKVSPKSTSSEYRYLRDQSSSGGFPFYIKALFFVLIGLVIAWYVVSRLPADDTTETSENIEQIPVEEEITEVVAEEEVLAESAAPPEFQFVMEDPNEPPYRVYASFLKYGKQVLRFDLPDGEVISSGTERIFVDLEIPEGTSLQSGIMAATLVRDECLPGDLEWSSKRVGDLEFKTAYSTDGAAGRTDHSYIYALQGDQCIHFMLTLSTVNAGIAETDPKAYESADGVKLIEEMLGTLKFN